MASRIEIINIPSSIIEFSKNEYTYKIYNLLGTSSVLATFKFKYYEITAG